LAAPDRGTPDRPLSAGRRRHPPAPPCARRRSRLDRLAGPRGALSLCREGKAVNAPFHAGIHSLKALAVALLHAACGKEAQAWDRAQLEAMLEALTRAPVDEEAILAALARRFELTDGELLAAALCLAVESDPKTARLVAAAQTPVGGS